MHPSAAPALAVHVCPHGPQPRQRHAAREQRRHPRRLQAGGEPAVGRGALCAQEGQRGHQGRHQRAVQVQAVLADAQADLQGEEPASRTVVS